MIPELGFFALITAMILVAVQFLLPAIGSYRDNNNYMLCAKSSAISGCLLLFLSMLALVYSLVTDDFSVQYVAEHSNSALPLLYKISTAWSAHEGSMLLWVIILQSWTVIVAIYSKRLPLYFAARIISIMGLVNLGMLWFIVSSSNPFARLLPDFPIDGNDLSPLLQDKGLMLHPPILYCGYIGMVIPYAFAVAALLTGRLEADWLRWLKPYVLLVTAALTIGITAGSWWAYYELGWGGWWFWDPVENVSLMPWIISLALLHSLMVAARRQMFCGWVLLLSLIAFSLSVLGTFVVRSGAIESVHAFANSPERGKFLLQYLMYCSGGAFLLFMVRFRKTLAISINSSNILKAKLFLANNILLAIITLSILFGTIFPLIYELFTSNKIVIDHKYFNAIFIPLVLPVLILMPIVPLCKWNQNSLLFILNELKYKIFVSVFILIIFNIGFAIAFWIVSNTWNKYKNKGMWLAHLGIAIIVLGITVVSNYEREQLEQMSVGSSVALGDYNIEFVNQEIIEGGNFIGHRGKFIVTKGKTQVAVMYPEKRLFLMPDVAVSEVAIDVGLFRDLYIALGSKISTNTWTVRIHYKPLVRLIWLGGLLVALGIAIAAFRARKC